MVSINDKSQVFRAPSAGPAKAPLEKTGPDSPAAKGGFASADDFKNNQTLAKGKSFNDRILFVGLNPTSGIEVENLKKAVGKENLISIINTNDKNSIEKVTIGAAVFNLGNPEGIKEFIKTLN